MPWPAQGLGRVRRPIIRIPDAPHPVKPARRALPLRNLATLSAAGSLLLVAITVAIGGAGLFVWQQSSREALRINAVVEETQAMRGALYRQMKEVFDAVFLDDRDAVEQYRAHEREIAGHLFRLRDLAQNPDEQTAITGLERTYGDIRAHTEALLAEWPRYSLAEKRRALETELEQGSLRSYERAVAGLEALLDQQRRALQSRLQLLAWLSPLLLALPLAGAVGLLLWSPFVLQRTIIAPLVSVQRATEMISRGDLAHRVPEAGAAELQQLAHSVNRMAGDLAASRASLLRAEKEATLAALVPVVAHNIRNPLASIRATAQVANDPSLPADAREALEGIISTSDRLERWTHALLSYLIPLEPQRVLCKAAELVDNIAAMLHPRLAHKHLRLDLSGVDRDAQLNVDPQLVEQALHGLVLNAVEASPEGAVVRLVVVQGADATLLSVEDAGGGMPFAPQPRGLAPGPSTKRFGTGLGIPFAVKVFDLHGASVRFGASAGGAGTRVEIALPR
jgi:signal transduction histidine kinase